MPISLKYCLPLLLIAGQVHADEPSRNAPTPPAVVIHGNQTDQELSRDFVAGKLVIGKKRLQESAKQSVGEVLRTEPAITVGKDGRIGLLGLPGYTQVLVDGQPPSGGDPYAIDLIHVEKIEIIKSATAATGPFGIAGTINIIRRKVERSALTQLRLGATDNGGRQGANIAWSNNQVSSDSPLSYNTALSASHKSSPNNSRYLQTLSRGGTAAELQLEGVRNAVSATDTLLFNSEFAWAQSAGHKFSFRPDLGHFSGLLDSQDERHSVDDRNALFQQHSRQPLTSYALPVRWDWQMDSGSRLALQANFNRQRLEAHSLRTQAESDDSPHVRRHDETHEMTNRFLNLDFNTELDHGHEIQAGAKVASNHVKAAYDDAIDGMPDSALARFGASDVTTVDSLRMFAQDDWRIDKGLALNLGASVERRDYALTEGLDRNRASYKLWSPSLHISKKVGGDSKRQFRASLARTFQAPETDQMLLHPQINALAPCAANRLCTGNDADTADRMGNPHLLPERSAGLNLSYSQGAGRTGDVTVELYARDIVNKIGSDIAFEPVAWASTPRYVIRPANLGRAKVRGISLEGRGDVHEIWPTMPNLELLASLGLAHSELSDLPGMNNHIDGQMPWRVKFAANYTAKDWPLKLGIDAQCLPSDWVRNSLTQQTYQSHQFTLNANANWKINARARVTTNLDNLFPANSVRIDSYQNGNDILQSHSENSNHTRIAVRLEIKL
jgi:outer membrane receptor for ferrienterochelin and colicins